MEPTHSIVKTAATATITPTTLPALLTAADLAVEAVVVPADAVLNDELPNAIPAAAADPPAALVQLPGANDADKSFNWLVKPDVSCVATACRLAGTFCTVAVMRPFAEVPMSAVSCWTMVHRPACWTWSFLAVMSVTRLVPSVCTGERELCRVMASWAEMASVAMICWVPWVRTVLRFAASVASWVKSWPLKALTVVSSVCIAPETCWMTFWMVATSRLSGRGSQDLWAMVDATRARVEMAAAVFMMVVVWVFGNKKKSRWNYKPSTWTKKGK